MNLVLAGLVGLGDQPRPEVAGAILKCHEAHIEVIMLTGDQPLLADSVVARIASGAPGARVALRPVICTTLMR